MDTTFAFLTSFYPIIVTVVLMYMIQLLWSEMNFRSKDPSCKAPLPPGSMGYPIIGETIQYITKGSKFYEERFRKYGQLISTHLFGSRTIRIRGAENLRRIFYSEDESVALKYPPSTLNLFGSNTIMSARGSHHIHLRKCMASVFTKDAMEGYIETISNPFARVIRSLCEEKRVLAHIEIRKMLFDVMGNVLCGFEDNGNWTDTFNTHFDNIMDGLLSVPINLPGTAYRKAQDSKKVIFEEIERKIEEMEKNPRNESKKNALRIMIEHPLADGSLPTPEDVRDIAFDLMFASYSATSSACTSLLLKFIEYPEVVKKIREELDQNGLLNPEVPLSMRKINTCSYVRRVVLESLRTSPPIPASFRTVLKTFEMDGMQVPKGWKILFSIRDTINFSPSFKDSTKFDPDRFLPGRSEHQAGSRYNLPLFGGGARMCPGRELAKLILDIEAIEICRNCNFEMLEPETLKIKSMPCPVPTNNLPVRFTRYSAINTNNDTTDEVKSIGQLQTSNVKVDVKG